MSSRELTEIYRRALCMPGEVNYVPLRPQLDSFTPAQLIARYGSDVAGYMLDLREIADLWRRMADHYRTLLACTTEHLGPRTEKGWYPRTAEDVMLLPIGGPIEHQVVTCSCGNSVHIPRFRSMGVKPYHSDLVMFVNAPDGCWVPEIDDTGRWYRRLDT